MPTEKDLQLYITKRAHKVGMLCYKFSSPSNRGVPDLILVNKNGKAFFIEVKHPNGKGGLSEIQLIVLQTLKDQGATVYVVASREYADEVISRELDT